MSEVIEGFKPGSAARYNAKSAKKLGWDAEMPEAAVVANPGFGLNPLDSAERAGLALAVCQYQAKFGLTADGMLGRETWIDILKRYDFVDVNDEYFISKGRRRQLKRMPPYKLYSFDEHAGIDLHAGGDFTSFKKLKKRKLKRILLHWGGVNAKSCKNILFNRDLSSHLGVELGVAFQWLDIGHGAWHARWANTDTIGIDVCQQPTLMHFEKYKARGYDVFRAKNPAFRPDGRQVGEKIITTLDPRTAETVREVCRDLCTVFGIPFEIPRDEDGNVSHRLFRKKEFLAYSGILWHGSVSRTKWDVDPWIRQIFDEDFEYEAA